MKYSVTDPNTNKTYDYGPHRKEDAESHARRLGVQVVEKRKKPRNSDDGYDAMRDQALENGTWRRR